VSRYPHADETRTIAPFFSLTRAAWIPYALTWEPETGEFRRVEGPHGFASYRAAVEASRFLSVAPPKDGGHMSEGGVTWPMSETRRATCCARSAVR
jgi:hypothetical protein